MMKRLRKVLYLSYGHRRYQTVRYAFPIVVITALFASLASVISQGGSYITVRTTASTVKEGETFYIEVTATAHTAVNAVNIVLEYPESKIAIESIDTGTSVITLWTKEPYAKDGKIFLSGGTYRRGFIGEHTVARIRARAKADGLAYVSTDDATFVAGDGRGTVVEVSNSETDDTELTITDAALSEGALEGVARIDIVTDLDGDGEVSLHDVSAFMSAWFTKGKLFDFNGDGRMTFRDFSIILSDSFFK